jgi:diamine N-acetyltransferase
MQKRHIPPWQAGRVRLRLIEAQDLPRTLAWRNQEHVRRWFFDSEPLAHEQHAAWFARYQQRDDDFVFIIEETGEMLPSPSGRGAGGEGGLKKSSTANSPHVGPISPHPNPFPDHEYMVPGEGTNLRPIGQAAIYNIDWVNRTGEFGRLMIGEADAAGRGLAREATLAVVTLALRQLGLREVHLEVVPGNVRAMRVYEASGFEVTGRTEKAVRMSKRAAA